MYAPPFGYGPGNVFNLNAPTSQVQAHVNQQQQQQLPGQQQPQQMVYNPYNDPIGPPQLSPYAPIGAGMSGHAGVVGIGPNNGMAHMNAGNVPSYQTPYSSSPYSGSISASSANLPPNFMSTSNATSAYTINVPKASAPHHSQRIHASLNSTTPNQTGPKSLAITSGQQDTLPNPLNIQSQFSTSQNSKQHLPAPINTQKNQPTLVATAPRPSYQAGPQSTNSGSTSTTPQSPVFEVQERERVTILLNINKELLLELMRLQADHNESREDASLSIASDGTEKDKPKTPTSRYYYECMRRLQSNLAYLAARTDRNKPLNQLPTHPQFMSPPTPSSNLTQLNSIVNTSPNSSRNKDEGEVDRIEVIREYYRKLQALYPGVDPRKESFSNPATRAPQVVATHHQALKHGVMEQNSQQHKAQNDLLRQKMMQVQQNLQNPQRSNQNLEMNLQQIQR
ncbi:hypothetical protein K3495_g11907 [Podosphaera aphanis]|nr:hypothetical protein K3495_g11907 [Podosphaera aphanis]